jgi:hypothetical protein
LAVAFASAVVDNPMEEGQICVEGRNSSCNSLEKVGRESCNVHLELVVVEMNGVGVDSIQEGEDPEVDHHRSAIHPRYDSLDYDSYEKYPRWEVHLQ